MGHDLLSISEAAEVLGMSLGTFKTLRSLHPDRMPKTVRPDVRRACLFDRAEVERVRAERESRPECGPRPRKQKAAEAESAVEA